MIWIYTSNTSCVKKLRSKGSGITASILSKISTKKTAGRGGVQLIFLKYPTDTNISVESVPQTALTVLCFGSRGTQNLGSD